MLPQGSVSPAECSILAHVRSVADKWYSDSLWHLRCSIISCPNLYLHSVPTTKTFVDIPNNSFLDYCKTLLSSLFVACLPHIWSLILKQEIWWCHFYALQLLWILYHLGPGPLHLLIWCLAFILKQMEYANRTSHLPV